MRKKIFNKYYVLVSLLIFPYILLALMAIDESRGMLWVLFDQLYNLPLSWLGEPFFKENSDIGYTVLTMGRVISAIFYFSIWLVVNRIITKVKANKRLQSDAASPRA